MGIVIIIASLCVLALFVLLKLPKKKIIYVIFRYDDYSAVSQTNLELKIIEVFRKNSIAMTFAVIPFVIAGDMHDPSLNRVVPLPKEKVNILKQSLDEGVLDIALHGYSHQTNNIEQFSEFADIDYNLQLEKLERGKKFLENAIGVPVTTFVPPWNTYDHNTLKALKALKFSTISGDRTGAATNESRLKFLPCTCSLKRLKESAIQNARGASDPRPVIIVLFHEFEFLDIDAKRGMITFQEFAELVDWLNAQDDIYILSISQAIKKIADLSAERLRMAHRTSAMYRKQNK